MNFVAEKSVQSYSHFDALHWSKVYAERLRLGLAAHPERGRLVESHPLVGKTLVEYGTGRLWTVERVRRDWHQGWFLTALLECDGSHTTVVVSSEGCTAPEVLRQLDAFYARYQQPN